MNARTKNLRDLVREDLYVVDPSAVAEAMIVRSLARRVLPDMTFRGATHLPRLRSFRPHRGGRAFRLTRGERRPPQRSADDADPSHPQARTPGVSRRANG